MPSALGVPQIDDVWRAIDYEVSWLHARWAIYRQLYGTSEARVEILNRSAGTFAHMLQEVLLDDVQLGLAKLGDPPITHIKGGTVENLTLSNLSQLVTTSGVLTSELPLLLATYDTVCANIRDRRNKRIAHFDLKAMLSPKASMQGPSRAEIETALEALRNFMNRIALNYTGSQTAYDLIVLDSDGDSLIGVLKRGLRYWELVKDGTIASDDLRAAGGGNS